MCKFEADVTSLRVFGERVKRKWSEASAVLARVVLSQNIKRFVVGILKHTCLDPDTLEVSLSSRHHARVERRHTEETFKACFPGKHLRAFNFLCQCVRTPFVVSMCSHIFFCVHVPFVLLP